MRRILAAFIPVVAGWQVAAGAVMLQLDLVESDSGQRIPGMVRVKKASTGEPIRLGGLLCRVADWYSVTQPSTVIVADGEYEIEGIAGLETEKGRVVVRGEGGMATARVPLRRFSNLRATNRFGGNTHLHLQKMTREQADRYLHEHPTADGLDVLFISHLRRAEADEDYITNAYPIGALPGTSANGLLMHNGEEHRHNFGGGGEGFGHVMLLDIPALIRPVSIGPGIMKAGTDSPPLRVGIDEAKAQGGRAIWCHNDFGFEDVPNLVSGRLDAVNIFDGGSRDGYERTFYVYLNAGYRVPFSTGTDWGLYDYSRVYVHVEGPLSVRGWLSRLAEGRSFITNGPLLELLVNGAEPGETIALQSDLEEVRATGRCVSRHAFGTLELVQNGEVIEAVAAKPVGAHWEGEFSRTVRMSEPGWFALRTRGGGKNEFGKDLFSHTSAVYVTVGGTAIRSAVALDQLRSRVEQGKETIEAKAVFGTSGERQSVLRVYDEALSILSRSANP